MTSQLAVDIVVLPPIDTMNKIIAINRSLQNSQGQNWELDVQNCLPHLTLAMGAIKQSDLQSLVKAIEAELKGVRPITIDITSTETSMRPDGLTGCGLDVNKTAELQNLHEIALSCLGKFITGDAETSFFYSPPAVDELPNYWMKRFYQSKIRENYEPHITLGIGNPPKIVLPISFTANKIALCHLGRNCTCRKVFAEFSLE